MILSRGDKSIKYGNGESVGEMKNVCCLQPIFSPDNEGLKDIDLARRKMKQILQEQKKKNKRVAQANEKMMKTVNARKVHDVFELSGIPKLAPTRFAQRNGPILSKSGSGDCLKLPSIANSPLINTNCSFRQFKMTGAKLHRTELK